MSLHFLSLTLSFFQIYDFFGITELRLEFCFLFVVFFFLFLYSFSEYLGLIVCYQVSLQRDRQGVDEGKGGLGCI